MIYHMFSTAWRQLLAENKPEPGQSGETFNRTGVFISCFHQTFPQQRNRARRFCFREITRRIHFSTASTIPTRNNSNELSDRRLREEINSTEVRYAIQRQ